MSKILPKNLVPFLFPLVIIIAFVVGAIVFRTPKTEKSTSTTPAQKEAPNSAQNLQQTAPRVVITPKIPYIDKPLAGEPYHTICNNNLCRFVLGEGSSECKTNAECTADSL